MSNLADPPDGRLPPAPPEPPLAIGGLRRGFLARLLRRCGRRAAEGFEAALRRDIEARFEVSDSRAVELITRCLLRRLGRRSLAQLRTAPERAALGRILASRGERDEIKAEAAALELFLLRDEAVPEPDDEAVQASRAPETPGDEVVVAHGEAVAAIERGLALAFPKVAVAQRLRWRDALVAEAAGESGSDPKGPSASPARIDSGARLRKAEQLLGALVRAELGKQALGEMVLSAFPPEYARHGERLVERALDGLLEELARRAGSEPLERLEAGSLTGPQVRRLRLLLDDPLFRSRIVEGVEEVAEVGACRAGGGAPERRQECRT